MYDVFFLSHDEPDAAERFSKLCSMIASARHVSGIAGIHAAHRRCAEISRTSHFYVVDADNEIIDADFRFKVPEWDFDYVHLWYARNPLNGLEYGWGGLKLFPRHVVLASKTRPLDFTTSFRLKVVPELRSYTRFNTSALATWRSAFREAVKLTLSGDAEARERLRVWMSYAEGDFATEGLRGAREGHAFAVLNRNEPEMLTKINDYDWLERRFGTEIHALPR